MAWNLGSKIRKACPLRICKNTEHEIFDLRGSLDFKKLTVNNEIHGTKTCE